MITFSQGGAAKIKSKQFSEFGSWTIIACGVPQTVKTEFMLIGIVKVMPSLLQSSGGAFILMIIVSTFTIDSREL